LDCSTAVSQKSDNLIQLDESVPSVRQLMLKEQLTDLYQQPLRVNAFRGPRVRHGLASSQQQKRNDANSSDSTA